jgi:DNA polymerase-2
LDEGRACRGLLVHGYPDLYRDRLYFTGRLEDGRSFAVMESRWRPSILVDGGDRERWTALLSSIKYDENPAGLETFSGRGVLIRLGFSRYRDWSSAVKLLENRVPLHGDLKPAEAFLQERFIRGAVLIRGKARRGRLVDLVFPDPEMFPPEEAPPIPSEPELLMAEPPSGPSAGVFRGVPLRIASIDIETDTGDGSIRAVSLVCPDAASTGSRGLVRVLLPPSAPALPSRPGSQADAGPAAGFPPGTPVFHAGEVSLLKNFIEDIQREDPDVLTGWNFLDFDFPRLADRCRHLGIPFALGRSREEAKFFPAGSPEAAPVHSAELQNGPGGGPDRRWARRRSAAALVPGRQVVDALRVVRAGPKRFSDYTLDTVARAVLGEGKSAAAGGDKIAELDRLYREDPAAFGSYCYKDAELVLKILARTGLFRLTMERAALTGVFLDKAWTSVVSFERIYGMELRRRKIAPPPRSAEKPVSGASGGTVLEPQTGLFSNIGVFDFRSLYPTIMRTFNIDPLSHVRAAGTEDPIAAPNGTAFSRTPGILPVLIAGYFAARRRALDAGDDIAAHVYKILMNSFYGVLGTGACRYGRTELAGAITSFARKWFLISRDWFTRRGCRVLYGDTDSLFVETGLSDAAGHAEFCAFCGTLAGELNQFLAGKIRREYRLESCLELRFEKAYRRFMIPPLRAFGGSDDHRGRAKGYGGYLLHPGGNLTVEVKGMEAVRSDVTPLARRLQMELLDLVFSGGSEEGFRDGVFRLIKQLRSGALDGELVYRKRLSRPPEDYTASTPPQVKAARTLGWKGRRGTVEYVWTLSGPEPASMISSPYDYDHYINSQILPLVISIAAAAGWNTGSFLQKGRIPWENGQMELW